jgi:hypothetical protein
MPNQDQLLHRLASPSKQGYLDAFLAQTGLQPQQATMMYGEEIVEERGHLCKKFFVRYVPQDTADEIKGLMADCEGLQVKNMALQMVLAVVSAKTNLSNEQVVELLQAAEAQILAEGQAEVIEPQTELG